VHRARINERHELICELRKKEGGKKKKKKDRGKYLLATAVLSGFINDTR